MTCPDCLKRKKKQEENEIWFQEHPITYFEFHVEGKLLETHPKLCKEYKIKMQELQYELLYKLKMEQFN